MNMTKLPLALFYEEKLDQFNARIKVEKFLKAINLSGIIRNNLEV